MPYRGPEGDERAERIAELVRGLAANRRALLPLRPTVRDLGRIVKDPWKSGPVEVDRVALISELSGRDTVSVRTDPELAQTLGKDAPGKQHRLDSETLVYRRGKVETGRVTGPPERLDLLEAIVGATRPDDVSSVLLPRNLAAFERLVEQRAAEAAGLPAQGRRLVEEIERLVCALYDVPDELTEAVVKHALGRAGSGLPTDD